ncbi:MAG: DUF1573 domain-containing protein [Bacteroidia bacterium]|jgi:hypothetical protein|nr:DUF1573 domain-containing protein [Bacteroidota bacterium]MCZ2129913.1 DUF1573 domain-containing protein [Bacteroidia bacterium]
MKKIILSTLMFCFAAVSSYADGINEPPTSEDSVKFETLIHDFGEVQANSQARYEFFFTNNSDRPLEIKSVRASCGCTAPSYSKEPVAPKKKGSVVAVYSAPSKGQNFVKTITVETSHGTFRLTIKGTVVETEQQPQTPVRVN